MSATRLPLAMFAAVTLAAVTSPAAAAGGASPYWVPTPGSAFFSPSSVWNQPLGPDTPIDPSSNALVGTLAQTVGAQQRGKYGPWISTSGFSTPIYTVPEGQPTVYVTLETINPYLQSALSAVPLPPEALPASGSDGQLVVWQPSTGTMWEFWRLHQTLSGWAAKWGGVMSNVTTSPGMYTPAAYPGARTYWGATASGLPLLGGLITIQDLQQGRIDHALALGIPETKYKVWSWPATHTDGQRLAGIPEGTHLRLNPSLDLSTLNLSPVALMIAQAAQRYGIVVRDSSPTIQFYAEEPTIAGTNPYPALLEGRYPWQLLSRFPWTSLEVVQQQIDTEPPWATIEGTPAKLSAESSAAFTFSSSKPGSVFECELDSTPTPTQCDDGTFGARNLTDGWHLFQVRAIDGEGLRQPWAHQYWWRIDADPPLSTLTATPPGLTNQTTAQFAFSARDQTPSQFQCQLDGAGWSTCWSGVAYQDLPAGEHTFQLQATDAAGNRELSPVSYSWTIDTTPPATSIQSAPPGLAASSTASFTVSSSKARSSISCSLDGGEWQTCVPPARCEAMAGELAGCLGTVEYPGLADGPHALRVKAADAAGNTDPNSPSYSWTVDITPPLTTISQSPPAVIASPSAAFTFTAADTSASTFECALDAGAWSPCSSPARYEGLADGPHTFAARATDAAGNVEVSPPQASWTVDTDKPVTTISESPPASASVSSASFAFAATDSTSTVSECALDGGAFAPCTSPANYSGLADGPHSFQVRATDTAGNAEASPAGYSWTIDTTPPVTTISGAPPAFASSRSASFTLTVSKPRSSFQCQLDGAGYTPCSSPVAYTNLGDGTHVFQVRATDDGGNVETPAQTATWTVETTPPSTRIVVSPAQGISRTGTASFQFLANKPGASFQCQLDVAGFTGCTSPAAYSGLTPGTHTFTVRASDHAGNTDPEPPSQTFLVTPPALFAADSYLNAPLDPSAPAAAESAGLVSELEGQVNQALAAHTGPTIITTNTTTDVYEAAASTTPVKVGGLPKGTPPSLLQALSAVPIPAGARPTNGRASQITIWQPSSERLWELRGVWRNNGGWYAAWGGEIEGLAGNPGYFSPAGWGATATAIPLAAGMIAAAELQHGRIDHALAIQIPSTRAQQWAWPAQRTDGVVAGGAIPEGTRFRLPASLSIASLNLSPLVRMLAEAAQRYGIFVRGQAPQVSFYAEESTGTNPYPAIFGLTPLSQQLSSFPWADLEALPLSLSH